MDIDSYISENAALRRKLESKEEALLILSEELIKCRRERDKLKNISITKNFSPKESWSPEKYQYVDSDTFEALIQKNKALFVEIKDLRHKLQEAYSDLKVLRSERSRARCQPEERLEETTGGRLKEESLKELEEARAEIRQLRSDLLSLLDVKEELVTEREAYRSKATRLNHQLAALLRTSSSPQGAAALDIDALLMESKYTRDRLELALSEVELLKQSLAKYKTMVEKKRTRGEMEGGGTRGSTGNSECRLISQRQVLEMLSTAEGGGGLLDRQTDLGELRALCLALAEALQDRATSLAHQKRANRILGERVSSLERQLSGSGVLLNPSQVLLEGYSSTERPDRGLLEEYPSSDRTRAKDKSERLETPEALVEKDSVEINHIQNGAAEDGERRRETEEEEEGEVRLPEELQDLVNQALRQVEEELSHSRQQISH